MWKLISKLFSLAYRRGLQPVIPEQRDWSAGIGQQWADGAPFIICPKSGDYVEIGGG